MVFARHQGRPEVSDLFGTHNFFLQFQDVATVIAPEQSAGLLYCLGASVTTQLLL